MSNLLRGLLSESYTRCDKKKYLCKLYSQGYNEKQREKFQSFVFNRYVKLLKSFEEILDKKFPSAAKVYKVFSLGINHFKNDVLLLFKIYKKINLNGIFSLTRKEIEIYHQMPKDMVRVAPVLTIATGIPFGAAIFALTYVFPKQMLSYHFWSEEQRDQFAVMDHKKRLQSFKPVYGCLRTQLKLVKPLDFREQFEAVLENVGNGISPAPDDILKCKSLFDGYPFGIKCLGSNHLGALLKLHRLHRGWRRQKRLEDHAALIQAMDIAILNEGGPEKLTDAELKWGTFFRGLNPVNMKKDEILIWLKSWLLISRELDKTCYSLLLHCPILLAYKHPSNVLLLRCK